jgi:phospholipid/cholesterol/gamma-HCH transport system permease protein
MVRCGASRVHECRAPPVELPRRRLFAAHLERIGRGLCHALHQGYQLVGFFGHVVFETTAAILQPKRLRFAALVPQMEETGLNALPIVGLLSILVGVVFAYQGSDQLRDFGADCTPSIFLASASYGNLAGR